MRMKKIAAVMLTAALSCGGAMSSMAATWIQTGVTDWKYQKDDGTFLTDDWVLHTDGKWYYLGADGMMKKGWFQDKNQKWYFLDSNGAMQTGLINVDGKVYWMEPNGELFIGDKLLPSGLTFNFGLYGCTNGSPYTSNKFNSNGSAVVVRNVVSSGGGGGTTSTSTNRIPSTVKEEVNKVANNVSDSLEGLSGVVSDAKVGEVVSVSSKEAVVNVTAKLEKKDLAPEEVADVQATVKDSVETITDKADPDEKIAFVIDGLGSGEYFKDELTSDKLDALLKNWVTADRLKNTNATKGSVTVVVNGIEVTYDISIDH